jgi:Nuclease-related domain
MFTEHGKPGGSVGAATSNKKRIKVGAKGETATAVILRVIFRNVTRRVDVYHDVNIPGMKGGNIDHVVVSGAGLLLIESKRWRPGFYWTVFGKPFRNLTPVPSDTTVTGAKRFHTSTKTLSIGLENFLKQFEGTEQLVPVQSVVVVHSSQPQQPVHVYAYKTGTPTPMVNTESARRAIQAMTYSKNDPKWVDDLNDYIKSLTR